MEQLELNAFHHSLNATFAEAGGMEVVRHYGDPLAELAALQEAAGVLDLSFRGRLCLTGSDRVRFLNGQVTNNVKNLQPGQGCYAALVTAKGRMESDLNVHCLPDELLLDFEPGLTTRIVSRLEKYIVADDVTVVDLSSQYGLLGVQGPRSPEVLKRLELFPRLPESEFTSCNAHDETLGELVVVNLPRFGTTGFDLFVPTNALGAVVDRMIAAARSVGGGPCGWDASEIARIEAGIPRFGVDMDESNIALEAGIEARAVRYDKGCYIGQEVINRIHSIGQVAKSLRGLLLEDELPALPAKGAPLFHEGKEVGYVTSATRSPTFNKNIALGYVRREANEVGTVVSLKTADTESPARIAPLPFSTESVR